MSGFRWCFLGRCALLPSNKQKSPESLGFCGESSWSHQGRGERSTQPSQENSDFKQIKQLQKTAKKHWKCLHLMPSGMGRNVCVCVWMLLYMFSIQYVPILMYVLGGYFVVVYADASCMCMFVCVYSWSDRVNPVVCESELFIVWKPMRPSILSVTNDYLPPCMRTQTSRFSIWMVRVLVSCLFYVFTSV